MVKRVRIIVKSTTGGTCCCDISIRAAQFNRSRSPPSDLSYANKFLLIMVYPTHRRMLLVVVEIENIG